MPIVKTYELAHFAHLDQAKLADEGIDSFLSDENIVTINPVMAGMVGGIKLFVDDNNYEKATRVLGLNEYDTLQSAFEDPIEAQHVCPTCGSTEIIRQKSMLLSFITLFAFLMPFGVPTNDYLCGKCGAKWKSK